MLRVFQHWCSRRKLGLFAAELSLLFVACLLAAKGMARLEDGHGAGGRTLLAAFSALAVQAGLYFGDLYDLHVARADRARGVRLLRVLAGVAVLAGAFGLLGPLLPPGALFGAAAGALGAVLATRVLLPLLLGRPERILVLGSAGRAQELAVAADGAEDLCAVAGYLDVDGGGDPVGERDLLDAARRMGATAIVVARDERRGRVPSAALLCCRVAGVEVLEAHAFVERRLRRVPVAWLRPGDLAFADGFVHRRAAEGAKRALDLAASLVLTVAAAPLMVLAAMLVRLDSPGPVLYRQERVGRGGRVFELTKFRTMRTDAEHDGPQWASLADGRVTRIGRLLRKTRMDELPQILAVLRGDMSFVGPRPERPFFVEQLRAQIPFYGLREAVKPGITGWAQIRYPYGASVEDSRNKLELDLYYLKNRSFFLDLSILFHTVRHVLFARGAR